MSQLRVLCLPVVAGMILLGPGAALGDRIARDGEILAISDEVWGNSLEIDREDGSTATGNDNNGHGNNIDGVDSSNRSQGHGGPNGAVDASCDGGGECVDDEAQGGGSVMSVSKSDKTRNGK